MTTSTRRIGVLAAMLFGAALFGTHHQLVAQGGAKQAPIFEVDPFWPKPLPNHWVTGSTIGLSVDAQDNVWTIHRPNTVEDNFKAADIKVGDARGRDDEAQPGAPSARPPTGAASIGKCCKVAPPVLVYDQAGNLVKSWGGPGQGYDWPDSNHGITVDLERQRLAGRQRPEGHPGPEVQRRRHVPVSARQARRPQRQQRRRELLAAHEDVRRRGGQRDVHRRRVRQPPRHRVRRRHRQVQAALGRLRQQAERRTRARVQPRRARRRSSSTPCTA